MLIGLGSIAHAQIETNPGGFQTEPFTIADGDSFIDVFVRGTSSLDVTGGEVTRLFWAFDQSNVVISGGVLSGVEARDSSMIEVTDGALNSLTSRNTSTVKVTGGTMGDVGALEMSTLHFTGGTTETASVSGGMLNLSGGTVTFAAFASDGGTLTLSDGVVELIFDVLNASNTYNISGGTVNDDLSIGGTSIATISGGVINDRVHVEGMAAASISGGTIENVTARDTAEVEITNGAIQNVLIRDSASGRIAGGSVFRLKVAEMGTAQVTGGAIDIANAIGTATIRVSGGTHGTFVASENGTLEVAGGVSSFLVAEEESSITFTDGTVQEELFVDHNAVVEIFSGSIQKIIAGLDSDPDDEAFAVDIYGGTIGHIDFFRHGQVNVYGGSIDTMLVRTPGINIYGTGLELVEQDPALSLWRINGTLADGTAANILATTLPSFINLIEVPEPVSPVVWALLMSLVFSRRSREA